jgi:hypothetical protein
VISRFAREDLDVIKHRDRRLRKRLIKRIDGLLLERPHQRAELVPDPPGHEPRYFLEIVESYGVVYWILDPPAAFGAAPSVMWIESVVTRRELYEALAREAPPEP